MRIERRLRQPRWLLVAVPACSLVFAFFASWIVLLATGHDALSSYRLIFDAAFLNSGALGQTLIAATPLAFTGLAADVEEAHPERGRRREPGEGERGRGDERLAERAVRDEGGVEEPPIAGERVVTGREEDEPRGEEREDERGRRNGDHEPARLTQPPLNPDADRSLPP